MKELPPPKLPKAISLFTIARHAFYKHSWWVLAPSLLDQQNQPTEPTPMPAQPTPSVTSLSFPEIKKDIVAGATALEKDASAIVGDVVSEFTYTPKSSLTTLENEIAKLESYVASTNKASATNAAKINKLNAETAAKVAELNTANAANLANVNQATALIAQLSAITTPTGSIDLPVA